MEVRYKARESEKQTNSESVTQKDKEADKELRCDIVMAL